MATKIETGSFDPLIVYPVGKIYLSTDSTNPADLFSGTWERLKDYFLLAAGDTYAAGSTGGEAQHTLTLDEMPKHSHGERLGDGSEPHQLQNILRLKALDATNNGTATQSDWYETGLGDVVTTTYSGDSKPHNNMPPYLAVYA